MNILIIDASQPIPGMAEGKLNAAIARFMQEQLEARGALVRSTRVNDGYDVGEEVDKHLWADVIITQSPVYWFGNPWIYKKYIDEVFNAGLLTGSMVLSDGRTRSDPSKQYGSGGKMHGKKYMLSLTWNAPSEAFNDKSQTLFEGKSVDEVFLFNTASYKFCGVEILPSFSFHDVLKGADIKSDLEKLKHHLDQHIY